MRTTITIDDDLLEAAKAISVHKRIPLGKAVSELMRRGVNAERPVHERKGGFPTFSVPAKARAITPDTVKKAEQES